MARPLRSMAGADMVREAGERLTELSLTLGEVEAGAVASGRGSCVFEIPFIRAASRPGTTGGVRQRWVDLRIKP